MTDADIIAAIRQCHRKANIGESGVADPCWDEAWVDRGGTVFGPGPYLHVPVDYFGERITIRVYAPARLRRTLAKAWVRP